MATRRSYRALAYRAAVIPLVGTMLVVPAVPRVLAQEAPIKKRGLLQALRLNGLTMKELFERVTRRGIDFRVTPEDERASPTSRIGSNQVSIGLGACRQLGQQALKSRLEEHDPIPVTRNTKQ